jgi:hypothetical protein
MLSSDGPSTIVARGVMKDDVREQPKPLQPHDPQDPVDLETFAARPQDRNERPGARDTGYDAAFCSSI